MKRLADPTRFERATFAFGGQFPELSNDTYKFAKGGIF